MGPPHGRSPGDLFGKEGVLAELTKALAERALTAEMEEPLGEEPAEEAPERQNRSPNRRNGRSQKTVTTDSSKVVLDIPLDRNGSFDPLVIAKYQRRFPEGDRKIVSMYTRGMTTREIQGPIEEIYGFEAPPSLISAITEAVMDEVTAWQNRPLEPCYPGVFIDVIRVNIRSDGVVVDAEQRGAKAKKMLEIDPLPANTIRLMYRLAVEGEGSSGQMGVKAIVKHLNGKGIFTRDGGRWGIRQVHRVLMAHMQHAVAVGKEADRMQAGLGKLEQAMFTSALADRASYSRVDVNAPLIPAAAE